MTTVATTPVESQEEQLATELEMLAATGQINPLLMGQLTDELTAKTGDPEDEEPEDEDLDPEDEDEERKKRRRSRGGNVSASLVSITGRRRWTAGKITTSLLMLKGVSQIAFDDAEVSQMLISGTATTDIVVREINASLGATVQAPRARMTIEDGLVCADATTLVVDELIIEEGAVIGSALGHPFRIAVKRLEVKGPISVLSPKSLDIACEQAVFDEDIKASAPIRKAVSVTGAAALFTDTFTAPTGRGLVPQNQVTMVPTPDDIRAKRQRVEDAKRKREAEESGEDLDLDSTDKGKSGKDKKTEKKDKSTRQQESTGGALILRAESEDGLVRTSGTEFTDQPESGGQVIVLSPEDAFGTGEK